MASTFKYQGRSADTVRDRANKSSGDYDDWTKGNAFKPKEGANNIRILPYTWDPKDGPGADGYIWGDSWAIEVYIHRDVGPDKQTYLCLDKMKGEPCPICEARADINDEEMVKALKPRTQLLAYIVDRADEKGGPIIWRVPKTIENEVQTRSTDKKSGAVILVDHPDDGYDISFKKKGSGLNTDYSGVDVEREPSYLSEKQDRQDDWLAYVTDKPLPEQLIYFDYDYLEKTFRGGSSKGKERSRDEPTRTRSRDRAEAPAEEEQDRRERSRSREPEPKDDPPRERTRSRERSDPPAEEPDDEIPSERSGSGRSRERTREAADDPPKRERGKPREAEPEEEEEVKPGKTATSRARDSLRRARPSRD